MGKEEVEAAIGALEAWGRTIDFWVLLCAIGVAIFLTAEVFFSVAHWLNERHLRPLRITQSQLNDAEIELLRNKTEEYRLVRIKIEQAILDQLKPRSVSKEQHDAVVAALQGKFESITVFTDPKPDEETYSFARQVMTTLADAGIAVTHRIWSSEFDKVPVEMSGTDLFLRFEGDAPTALGGLLVQTLMEAKIARVGTFSYGTNDDQFKPLPSPALVIKPKPVPFAEGTFWVERPSGWVGDWPPNPPWKPK